MGRDKDSDDHDLWAFATRDVKPLEGRKAKKNIPMNVSDGRERPVVRVVKRMVAEGDSGSLQSQKNEPLSRDVDKRTRQRFDRGQMEIEGRLDLHGMNQGQARVALHDFIHRSYREGKRKVLVITGKGRTKSREALEYGVLRKNVPLWLDEKPVRSMVLRMQEAQPEHGGGGALYVLLRRDRR